MKCERHPNIETSVRCGRCEIPVCPKCSVFGPAGIRCHDCAGWRSSHVYDVPGGVLLRAAAVCAPAGVLGGYLLAIAAATGFFALWAGVLIGAGMGELALRVTGHKRGRAMEVLVAVCTLAGCLVGLAIYLALRGGTGVGDLVAFLSQRIFTTLAIAASLFVAVSRVRSL